LEIGNWKVEIGNWKMENGKWKMGLLLCATQSPCAFVAENDFANILYIK
jgi:hypothetical protein